MEFRYDKYNKWHRLARAVLITVCSLATLIWIWWIISRMNTHGAFPDPFETFEALVDLYENGDPRTHMGMWDYIFTSLKTLFYGFLLAFVVAVILGVLMGAFKPLREFATPMIEVLRPIAPLAWAGAFVRLTQSQTQGTMLVVFVGVFFPLLTNVIFGVSKIETNLIDAAKTLGASPLQVFVKIILPSTIPYVMNGVKIGLGIGWMCIVAAEMVSSSPGIGFYVAYMDGFSTPHMFAGIIIISILGLLTTGVAEYLHKVVNRRMGVEI